MIEIIFYQNGFVASGHAESGPYGSDLVCAGVSAILIGALNWFNSETKIVNRENLIQVITNQKEYLDLLKIQLQAIQSNYSKYISIKIQDQKI